MGKLRRPSKRPTKERLTIGSASDILNTLRSVPPRASARKSAGTEAEPDWSSVDWSLSDRELAATHGCSYYELRAKRQEIAPGTGPSPFRDVWSGVDWSLPDWQIAASLHLAVEAVAAGRRRAEARASAAPKRRGPPRKDGSRPGSVGR